jgi:hypothetical protein
MVSGIDRSTWRQSMAALALAVAGLLPASAAAKPVIVGSPLEGKLVSGKAGKEGTYFNSALGEPGANVTSPIDGAIISLNMEGIGAGIPYRLRILSPNGGSSYTARASSKTIIPDAQGDGEFRSLLIKAGETVGIDMPAEGKLGGYETGPGSAYAFWVPPLGDGSALPYNATQTGRELAFNVEVLPKPTITKVTPGKVDLLKKTQIKIHGSDLQHVVRVSFGDRGLTTWRMVNERLIVAKTPPIKRPRETHVRVVTAAGPSAPNRPSLIDFR